MHTYTFELTEQQWERVSNWVTAPQHIMGVQQQRDHNLLWVTIQCEPAVATWISLSL